MLSATLVVCLTCIVSSLVLYIQNEQSILLFPCTLSLAGTFLVAGFMHDEIKKA